VQTTILGTAAAEAIPNPFCRCEVCRHARRVRGRELCSRSAALINDDFGLNHAQLVEHFRPHTVQVAYDGLVIVL
jgi:phosphoribosyl 1,2-cyclic phosphodiesterase